MNSSLSRYAEEPIVEEQNLINGSSNVTKAEKDVAKVADGNQGDAQANISEVLLPPLPGGAPFQSSYMHQNTVMTDAVFPLELGHLSWKTDWQNKF